MTIDYYAYRYERSTLLGVLSMPKCELRDFVLRHAAVYVIGWGC